VHSIVSNSLIQIIFSYPNPMGLPGLNLKLSAKIIMAKTFANNQLFIEQSPNKVQVVKFGQLSCYAVLCTV